MCFSGRSTCTVTAFTRHRVLLTGDRFRSRYTLGRSRPRITIFWSLHRSSLSLGRFLRGSGAVWKANMHRVWVAIVLVSCSLFLFVAQLWSRLMLPPSMADVRELAEKAPLVFRGHVLEVIPLTFNAQTGAGNRYIAKIQVDRWYRGGGPTEETLRFAYGSFASNGHDCIDFRPESYWVVFAHEESGQLELIDDCEGALTISPLLGRDLGTEDWLAQMEADFLAGLNDHDSAARLSSIQRLGGLKLPSSRVALRGVIENGNAGESKWAVYAALRTGDVSVLPRVRQLLAAGDRERKSTRLNSSHLGISYAVFCLQKKIAGLDEPSGGHVEIMGRSLTRRPEAERVKLRVRHIGVSPQTGNLFDHLFFFNDTATTEIYTLSLHDALPI